MRAAWLTGRRVVAGGIGVALLAAFLAAGLSRITLDVDVTRLLPPGLKETVGYRLFLKNFAGSDELMVTLEGEEAEAVEAAAGDLERALRQGPDPLARRVVWRSPFEAGAGAGAMPDTVGGGGEELAEFLAWGLLNQPSERFGELERRLGPDELETTLAQGLESLATSVDGLDRLMGYDPLGLTGPLLSDPDGGRELAPSLASGDGRFRLMFVEAAHPLADYKAMGKWLAEVRTTALGVAGPHRVVVRLTGEPAFVSEISTSMEHDMKVSGLTALVLICLVVWIGYRDLRLLPVLAGFVGVIFVFTLATAGLLSGSLTVLTVGCGSILIGLTVDYGVLVYAADGGRASQTVFRRTRRGIVWAAATTAASFGALVFAGMPGLAELGLLVMVGVIIGAILFLSVYPLVLRALRLGPRVDHGGETGSGGAVGEDGGSWWADRWAPAMVGGLVMAGLAGLMVRGAPKMDLDSGALRPRVSEAYDTLDRLTEQLGGGEASLSVLVAGRDENEVAARLAGLSARLDALQKDGVLESFALPQAWWPTPAHQRSNLLGPGSRLAADEARLRAAVQAAGYSEEAFGLTSRILDHWRTWAVREQNREPDRAFWPEGPAARWVLSRFAVAEAVGEDATFRSLCLGLIRPRVDPPDDATLAALAGLQTDGVFLAGSKLIGRVMEAHLGRSFFWLAVIFSVVTLGLLAVALRRAATFLLTLVCLGLSFGALIGLMSWWGLGWNSFTLPALLLCLGTGSDYFIYAALELQDHGSVARLRARLLRPLAVCVGASVAGFGSLAWAGNIGLSNLGRVCALALALNVLVALFLMPWIWRQSRRLLRR